jgi:hypothetical protein
MRFTVQNDKSASTVLCGPDGIPVYQIEKAYIESGKKGTRISRITPAGTTEAIATIQKNKLRSNKIILNGGMRNSGVFDR